MPAQPFGGSAGGRDSRGSRGAGLQDRPHQAWAPPSRSSVIGPLFRDLRKALHLSLPETAKRLQTTIAVIEALESGEVRRLPAWQETVRVVAVYTRLAGIDPLPVLEVIRRELEEEARTLDLKPAPAAGQSSPRSQLMARVETAAGSVTSLVRSVSSQALPVPLQGRGFLQLLERAGLPMDRMKRPRTLVALMLTLPLALFVSWGDTGFVRAMATVLPEPLSAFARGVDDMVVRARAPVRDGLTWIEVDDPRSRKGDKLQISPR